ncbi:MAG: hypothetical protein EAZ62_08430 [Sphingobacteriia bacterium]|nr:MAG: hypothetical protein EAZ62_08430 [Sphingobacteriia bacterium]
MRKIFLVIALLGSLASQAQSKFEGAMAKGLGQMKEAKTAQDMLAVSAFFERVADAEKDKWLAYYYAAHANIVAGWMDEKADKDKLAGKSSDLIAKAEALEKNNSEISCLKQMVAIQQLMVDPMSRWQSYGQQASAAIDAAIKADPKNPRAYSLQGQYLMNVPEAFGGGKAVAKPILEKAVALYKSQQPASPFHPTWGQADAEKALASCQ